jgi:hypothetical protein
MIHEASEECVDSSPPSETIAGPAALEKRAPEDASAWLGIVPETTSGEDLLDFRAEARSIATLLLEPRRASPLTLAIFGDWGSGKTFFMGLLREELEACAAGPEAACRVVQVDFNAWRYAQANVWSALFHEVTRALAEALSDGVAEQGWTRLAERLETGAALRAQLERQQEQSLRAKQMIDQRRQQLDRDRAAIAKPPETVNLERIVVRRRLVPVLQQVASTTDPSKLRGANIGGLTMFQALFIGRGVWVRTGIAIGFFWVVGMFLVAPSEDIFWDAKFPWWFPSMPILLGSLIGAACSWSAVTRTKGLQELKAELRRQDELATEQAHRLETLDNEARRLGVEAARNDDELSELRQRLAQAPTSRSLSDYVQKQLKDAEGQTYLGLREKLRRDFSAISDALRDAEHPTRVILYIDDLDRCPAARVVETLEAIHLLFRFPAFVVVLAADARWLTRSLERQYSGQLDDPFHIDGAAALQTAPAATSFDYLEKIIQIPVWLPRLDGRRMRGFIEHQLRDVLERSSDLRKEMDALVEVGELLGENPRTTKRFLNTYRWIRSILPSLDQGAAWTPARFETLSLFLALAVAQAPLTRALTDHLRRSTAQLTVGEWLNSADSQLRENPSTRHIWATHEPTVRKVLGRHQGHERSLREIATIADLAQRYSFLNR